MSDLVLSLFPGADLLGMTDIAVRLEAKIETIPETGCWLFIGAQAGSDYGCLVVNGRLEKVHRIAWRLAGGEIPTDLELDHRCRVRRCCNPTHLRLVTHRENLLLWGGCCSNPRHRDSLCRRSRIR